MSRFTASEIASIAVKIEENGRLLYNQAAASAADPEHAAMFSSLAKDEAGHKGTFSRLLASLGGRHEKMDFPGDRALYVIAVADAAAFTPETAAEAMNGLAGAGPDAVIDFALDREHETILFYETVLEFLPRKDRRAIVKIIEEENRHVETLEGLKK